MAWEHLLGMANYDSYDRSHGVRKFIAGLPFMTPHLATKDIIRFAD